MGGSSHGDKLAIDYIIRNMNPIDLDNKNSDYKYLNINNIWILSDKLKSRDYKTEEELALFKRIALNESSGEVLIFLDVDNEVVTMMKEISIDYRDYSYNNIYNKKYNLKDIKILSDGTFKVDFFVCGTCEL